MRVTTPFAAVSLLAGLLCSAPAAAQNGFLFDSPRAQLTLRAGGVMHSAQSDVFEFFTTELTLDRSDFRAPSVGADLGIVLNPRLDLTFGLSWSEAEQQSEFRDWVDQDDQPIEQMTTLRVVPATIGVRFYPLARGEAVSSLAWVPARTTPYVGAGGGLTFYRLRQHGDFVQLSDNSIFADDLESSGQGLSGHVAAGVDHWFSAKVGLNAEARYAVGKADTDDDFLGHAVDLGGFQAGLGLAVRW